MAALAERAEPPELDAREAAVVLPMPPPDVIHMSPRAGPAGGAAAARTPIPAPRVAPGSSVASVYKHRDAGAAGAVTATRVEELLHYQTDAPVVSPSTGLPMPKIPRGRSADDVYAPANAGGLDPTERLNQLSRPPSSNALEGLDEDAGQFVHTTVATPDKARPQVARTLAGVKQPLW